MAQPLLALAGIRINPRTHAECSTISYNTALLLKPIEHILYEMLSLFDRHVKNAPLRQ